MRRFRQGFLFSTVGGIFGFSLLNDSQRQDGKGYFRSMCNAIRMLPLMINSVHLYRSRLRGIPYPSEEYVKQRAKVHTEVAQKILYLAETNRGVYLKGGQYISTLQNIAPKQYVEVLKVLQDSGPSLPFKDVRPLIERELGDKTESLFQQIDQEAIAAASLAQVHRGVLKNGQEVAIKVQFPFLRVQTPYDLFAIRNTIRGINYLLDYYQYDKLDLLKFYTNFQGSLLEELDFNKQAQNAETTMKNFQNEKRRIYIPKVQKHTKRVLVMEFIRGRKISDIEGLRSDFPQKQGVKNIGFELNAIFGKMLFKHGHIHCDAHPGNILVRRLEKGLPEIVLLDHGFYASLDKAFMHQFCELWFALVTFNNKRVREIAQEMGVGEYYRYLPILFTYRTINSKKPFAARFNKEEKKFMVQNDEINFEKISYLLQLLPAQLTFIFKAIHCVGIHNSRCGGTTKDRLLTFSNDCIDKLAQGSRMRSLWLRFVMWVRILLFTHCFPIFRLLFGFEEAKFDPQSKAMLPL